MRSQASRACCRCSGRSSAVLLIMTRRTGGCSGIGLGAYPGFGRPAWVSLSEFRPSGRAIPNETTLFVHLDLGMARFLLMRDAAGRAPNEPLYPSDRRLD